MANLCSNQCSCKNCEKVTIGELLAKGVVCVGAFVGICCSLAQMMANRDNAAVEENTAVQLPADKNEEEIEVLRRELQERLDAENKAKANHD